MEDNLKKAIDQMKRGEEKGFNAVYSATYNRVYFRAKQIMKKEEDAQDLTQIVFAEAYKNIHTLQAEEALYSWIDGITYNQGMKIYRKQKDVLLTEEAEGIFEEIESNDISSMPELTADQKATADIIKGIIEELPELQRTAVVAYYFDGLKVEQIAEMMECSVNTVKSRLSYARKYMKTRVEEKEKEEGYRLHVLGLPVLWYALKALAEETTLTAYAAEKVYSGACSSVGLQATTITASTAGAAAGTTTGATAGVTAVTTGAGTATIGTTAVTAGTAAATGGTMNIVIKNLVVAGLGLTLSFAGAFGFSQMQGRSLEITTVQEAQAVLDGQTVGETEAESGGNTDANVDAEAEPVQDEGQGATQDTAQDATQDTTQDVAEEAKEGEIQFDWSLDDWTFNGIHISECSYSVLDESFGFNESIKFIENWNGYGPIHSDMVTSSGTEIKQIWHYNSEVTHFIAYEEVENPERNKRIRFSAQSGIASIKDFSYITDVPYTFGDYEVFDPIFHISNIIEKGELTSSRTSNGYEYTTYTFTSNLGEGTLNVTRYPDREKLGYSLSFDWNGHQMRVNISPSFEDIYYSSYSYYV